MIIVATKRTADWHACIEDEPGYWDCGSTRAEAIGNLIISHRERFNVFIKLQEKTNAY